MNLKKTFFLIAKILLSGLILFYVVKKLNFEKIALSLSSIKLQYLLLIFVFLIISLLLMSLKWNLFLRKHKKIKLLNLIKIYWASDFINLFGLASIGGETYKTMIFKQDRKKVLFSSLTDKLYSFLWYILFAGSIFLGLYIFKNALESIFFGLILFSGISFIVICLDPILKKILIRLIKIQNLKKILEESIVSKKDLFFHLVYSILFIINLSLFYGIVFYSLGLPIKFLELFVFIPILMIGLTLPISFQGIGIREFLFIKFAGYISLVPEKVLLASFIIYLSALVYGLSGVISFLLNKKRED